MSLQTNPIFKPLAVDDIPSIVTAFANLGWNKSASLYEAYLEEQSKGKRDIWVAWNGRNFLGYITLVWHSEYAPFHSQNIPEIKDLNVLPQFRNQGLGSKLLSLAESKAFQKVQRVGLSVGLTADYGDAQRLYINRGYLPDGEGISYDHKPVCHGDMVQVDDDLVLWLIKPL